MMRATSTTIGGAASSSPNAASRVRAPVHASRRRDIATGGGRTSLICSAISMHPVYGVLVGAGVPATFSYHCWFLSLLNFWLKLKL